MPCVFENFRVHQFVGKCVSRIETHKKLAGVLIATGSSTIYNAKIAK